MALRKPQVGALLIGLAMALAAALVAFFAVRSGTHGSQADQRPLLSPVVFRTGYGFEMEGRSLEDLTPAERSLELRDEEWRRTADFLPISAGVDALAGRWRSSLADPSGVLEPGQGAKLLGAVARRAWALGQPTPAAYTALVAEQQATLQWNRDAAKDFQIGIFYRYFLDRPLDDAAPHLRLLEEVWNGLREHEHLPQAVGHGEHGAAFLVQLVRTPAQLDTLGLSGKHALNAGYWQAVAHRYGMRFTRPAVTADDVLERRASAVIAHAHVLIRLQDGRIANWMSTWLLDPESGEWVCQMSQTSSGKTAMIIW